MTATTKTMKTVSLGDRFSELAVILLTVVALALGWWLKSSVENRGLAFSNDGITARTPIGWLVEKPGGLEVLQTTDRTASGFGTTYLIQKQAAQTQAKPADVASLLTLDRGNTLTGYRVLDQRDVLVQGRSAVEIEYVYVESAANLTHAVIPAVVHGLDYVFVENGKAVIITYRADQSRYDTDLARFNRFLVSVKF
jgi:hypothetical protein